MEKNLEIFLFLFYWLEIPINWWLTHFVIIFDTLGKFHLFLLHTHTRKSNSIFISQKLFYW